MAAEVPAAPAREPWKEAEPGRCGEGHGSQGFSGVVLRPSPREGFYRSWGDSAGPGVSAMEPREEGCGPVCPNSLHGAAAASLPLLRLPTLLVAPGMDTAINNSNNERVCSKRDDFMKLHF